MQRKLSGIEALWWIGGRYPLHFAMTARFRGRLSVDQLRAALMKVRQKQPILAVRLFMTEDQTWWCTSEGVPDFPIQVVSRGNDDHWMREIEADYDNLFPANGPLLRFIVLQGSDVCDLVMMFHHCMYDGLSAVYALRDIMHYLALPDTPAEPVATLPGISDLIPDSAIQALTQNAPPSDSPASQSAPLAATSSGEHHLRVGVFSWALTEAQTTALIQRCRNEQTTVHSAICTAFMFAFAKLKIIRDSPVRTVRSPVNLRAQLKEPVGEAIGMLMTPSVMCNVDCPPQRDFWEAAHEFKSQLKRQTMEESIFGAIVGADQSLGGAPYSSVVDGFLQGIKTPRPFDILVTNLGVITLPMDCGSLHLEAIYGPMVTLGEYNCVCGISTIGGKAFFMLTLRHRLISSQTAEQLIDQMRQQLGAAVRSA